MMGHTLPHEDDQVVVRTALDRLREQCGDSGFGYRMQALFAHVLIRLGFVVTEINTKGHPDVLAVNGDRTLRVQVKTVKHGSSANLFELAEADCHGIGGSTSEGVLALLDCAEPVRWVIVAHERARQMVGRRLHLAALRGDEHRQLSEECSDEFKALVLRSWRQLPLLPYGILRDRALKGDPL